MKSALMLLLLYSTTTFALVGQEGGGGHVVACYTTASKDSLQSVGLYDLWEQKALTPHLNYLSFQDLPSAFTFMIQKLAIIDSSAFPNSWYDRHLVEHARKIYEEILNAQNGNESKNQFVRFLKDDVGLKPIPDLENFIEPQDDRCAIQTMANYRADGLLYISKILFDKMSALDQVAFILHETVYRYRRVQGEPNSVYARRLTAQTMAGTTLVNADDGLRSVNMKSVLKCSTTNNAKYVFYAYEDAAKAVQIQFERIYGFDALNKTTAKLKLDGLFTKYFFKNFRCESDCINGEGFAVKSSWTDIDGFPESIYLQHSSINGVVSWSVVDRTGDKSSFECKTVPVTQ